VCSAEELAATIDELLDLTRIEAGQLRLQRESIDLDALMEQAARSPRPRFEDAAIRLRIVHEAPPALVRGGAARLRIIFVNLLDNALKYTPAGGEVEVRLSVAADADKDGLTRLRIETSDTGPGVPTAFRERIFEKFFRVEHHRGEEGQGMRGAGIGLYLCRQIIEAHGGSIRREAGTVGRGTRFLIELPIQDPSEPEAQAKNCSSLTLQARTDHQLESKTRPSDGLRARFQLYWLTLAVIARTLPSIIRTLMRLVWLLWKRVASACMGLTPHCGRG
jgi:signal transduction histidine kinase